MIYWMTDRITCNMYGFLPVQNTKVIDLQIKKSFPGEGGAMQLQIRGGQITLNIAKTTI